MRGEKILGAAGDGYEMGSPPRARGKGGVYEIPAHRRGITPACAGKRVSVTALQPVRRDHPRVRGEKIRAACRRRLTRGSPPRARGKVCQLADLALLGGITPACAGKRMMRSCWRAHLRDHPRVRGEKPCSSSKSAVARGSPPRARGKGLEQFAVLEQTGITPACAGKRSVSGCPASAARDHPRVRGEKTTIERACRSMAGSPPRARGKATRFAEMNCRQGITPACAGKSTTTPDRSRRPWDHPRVRGEKCIDYGLDMLAAGSPPRARGKVCSYSPGGQKIGITPACAGKSTRGQRVLQVGRDHPRVRGEKIAPRLSSICVGGSPPRARGKERPAIVVV